jgi:endo-1,3(4)-beta-glucanase
VLSAAELGASSALTTDSHGPFSVNANLASYAGGSPLITFPLVQGMGFVTAIYNSASVVIRSSVFFKTVVYMGDLAGNTSFKYRITLSDDTEWLLYVTPNVTDVSGVPPLKLIDSTELTGPTGFQGIIQVAKNPAGDAGEAAYDSAAGAYATSALVSATTNDEAGSYNISWTRGGIGEQMLFMFALPHHMESLVPDVAARVTPIQLATTSKGMATGVLTNFFAFSEPNLPVDIGFEPWSPIHGNIHAISPAASQSVDSAARVELQQNMTYYSNLNSMYYSGKVSIVTLLL